MSREKNELKITTTLTEENKKKFRKAIYLMEKTKKDVFNQALQIGLDELLKELEKKKEE
jgi:hypothetical protein